MPSDPVETGRASITEEVRDPVRAVLDDDGEMRALWRAISAFVCSVAKGRPRHEVAQRVDEVFSETVKEALAGSHRLRAGYPALPWLVGIAKNVVRGAVRDGARRVSTGSLTCDGADLDRIAQCLSGEGQVSDRMDVEMMLSRLKPGARRAVECRFLQGLDGDELAQALGAPSAGAARVRVSRAVQELRGLFGSEVAR
jgi:DNA-directed RNA polymerase specialized sigma24 family protein